MSCSGQLKKTVQKVVVAIFLMTHFTDWPWTIKEVPSSSCCIGSPISAESFPPQPALQDLNCLTESRSLKVVQIVRLCSTGGCGPVPGLPPHPTSLPAASTEWREPTSCKAPNPQRLFCRAKNEQNWSYASQDNFPFQPKFPNFYRTKV